MSQKKLLALIISVLILLLAACGGGSSAPASDTAGGSETTAESTEAAAEETAPEAATEATGAVTISDGQFMVDPLMVEGDIILAGSSTVFPLAEAIANRFVDEGYAGNITIDSIGSGAGFERFCVAGESDISNASRPIHEDEIANCQGIGRDPIEFRIGTDALAIAINPENDWVTDVTVEELAAIFTAENWSDVNPEWPAEPIQRFIPGTDSGTFDYFVEEVFDEDPTALLEAANTQLSEDDNVLVQGIQGSPYAIGFFGYAYYEENQDVLNVLNVDGVEPNAESVDAGEYALARPLFMYSAASIISEKPQVGAFLAFVLSTVNDEIVEVGYFPAHDDVLDEARMHLADALGMEMGAAAGGEEAAAAEGGDMAGSAELPEVNPLEVEGDIILAGSSTVFPLAEAIANRFVDEGYAGNITIDSIGSGAGFERFCVAGESDISNASRPIHEDEIANCQGIGRDPIEFRIGTDALAVVVNPENDWVTDVTVEELAAIFTAENWSDVNAEWPAEPIQRFIPGTDSGTFDYFVEEVFAEDPTALLEAANTQLSEDDNVLVQGVEGSPYSIGFFGYAYYAENTGALRVLNIEGVAPNAESVDAGEYPLARPLFMYSAASIIQEKPQVGAFLNFVLTTVNDEISDVGYFPADASVLDGSRAELSQVLGQ